MRVTELMGVVSRRGFRESNQERFLLRSGISDLRGEKDLYHKTIHRKSSPGKCKSKHRGFGEGAKRKAKLVNREEGRE